MGLWFVFACVPPIEVDSPPPAESRPLDDSAPPPAQIQVNSVSPTQVSASGGDLLVISGSGFSEGVKVSIGGQDAAVGVVTHESIGAVAPPGADGMADIVVTLGDESATLPAGIEYLHDYGGAALVSVWGWIRENPLEGLAAQDWNAFFDDPWVGDPLVETSGGGDPDVPFGRGTVDSCIYLVSPGIRDDLQIPYMEIEAGGESERLAFNRGQLIYVSRLDMPAAPSAPVYVSWPAGDIPALDGLELGVMPAKAPTLISPSPGERVEVGDPFVVEWEPMGGEPMEMIVGYLSYPTLYCVVEDDGSFEVPLEDNVYIRDYADGQYPYYVELAATTWTESVLPVSNAVVQAHLSVVSTVPFYASRP